MKPLHWLLGIVQSLALILILLVTSFQIAAYGDYGFYEKEYEKYQVLQDLDMEMDDVMYVTEEMMAYLIGEREQLSVETTVEGEWQDFFNEQDRLHMADVKELFLGGLALRRGAAVVCILSFLLLLFLRADWKRISAKGYQISLGITGGGIIFLGIACAVDFNMVFTRFHEIFFSNDLWLFDPAVDYMIRMLPEGFFYDMAVRIAGFWMIGLVIMFLGSLILSRTSKKKGSGI